MREIVLPNGTVTIVDDDDYERIGHLRWYSYRPKSCDTWYVIRRERGGKAIAMHREIMGFPDGMDVDHVDGDGLNNCKSNLRVCTRGQNLMNKRAYRKRAKVSSKFKGVTAGRNGQRGGWKVSICAKGVRYDLKGVFATEVEAARAYDQMALRYHGKFARLNFPQQE